MAPMHRDIAEAKLMALGAGANWAAAARLMPGHGNARSVRGCAAGCDGVAARASAWQRHIKFTQRYNACMFG